MIDRIIEKNHKVISISRTDPCIKDDLFQWICQDLSSAPCEVNDDVDIIVHMASQSLLNQSAEEYTKKNIMVTYNTREMAVKLQPKVIIYSSSIKVYGEIRDDIVSEETDFINPDLYGITKYLGEKIMEEAESTISLRMPGVIAVGSHGWIDSNIQAIEV